MSNVTPTEERSEVLPSDPFEIILDKLMGLPNGAHTHAALMQAKDYYGNITQYIVQTVRWDEGDTAFITVITSKGRERFMLPPKVLGLIERQRLGVSNMVKRRHGKRLAEERKAAGTLPTFTPEMRAKALATRKAKAKARRARREKRGGK